VDDRHSCYRDTILLAHASRLTNADDFVLLYEPKSVALEFSLFTEDPFSKLSGS